MKAFALHILAAIGRWLWDFIKLIASQEVKAERAAEEVQDDIRLADQAEALRVERIADTVPRELSTTDKPARRGRRPSPSDTTAGDA